MLFLELDFNDHSVIHTYMRRNQFSSSSVETVFEVLVLRLLFKDMAMYTAQKPKTLSPVEQIAGDLVIRTEWTFKKLALN